MPQKSEFSLKDLNAEILHIADTATLETLNLAKLRIDARKWLAGRIASDIAAKEKNLPPPLLQRIETILIDPALQKETTQNESKAQKRSKKSSCRDSK